MDTIFAPATPLARSAVAVVRVSGPRAREAVLRCTALAALPEPRKAAYASLRAPNTGEILDRALLLWFPAPRSFTGEDSVEWHIHGGPAVMRRCLDALASLEGFRFAAPGEFSRRAFDNRKMDVTELEGLADMLAAETEEQARQAVRALSGELGAKLLRLRDETVDAQAYMEAYIDFPDEPIPPSVKGAVAEKAKRVLAALERYLEEGKRGRQIREGVRVALFGAPNAGKSTLMNLLSASDSAIVSDIPGTTRDSIVVKLDLDGYPVLLVDTAGIRETSDAIEQEGVRRALRHAEEADVRLPVVDVSDLPASLPHADAETIVVCNKTDKAPGARPVLVPGAAHCYVSLRDDPEGGTAEILSLIRARLRAAFGGKEGAVVTRERHRFHLQEAADALRAFDIEAEAPEIAAERLRHAAFHIGCVAGFADTEDMLDKLFREFCVGK
jgi:tRNA modification GTPase